jgi:hypothetical protein
MIAKAIKYYEAREGRFLDHITLLQCLKRHA